MLEEKKPTASAAKPKHHHVSIENREKGMFTGILEVDSFNSECIIAKTELGEMRVSGSGLHISKLNLDSHELYITGTVNSLSYGNAGRRGLKGDVKSNIIGRVFK